MDEDQYQTIRIALHIIIAMLGAINHWTPIR